MLTKFKDIHQGEVGLIIGNGPSLKDCPIELMEKYISFGANKIYRFPPKVGGFCPNYYTVIDEHMIHNISRELNDLVKNGYKPDAMFIRRPYPIRGAYHINTIVAAGFSTNINKSVVMGGTVTYASLQIAWYMGIRTVLLVGVDHNYPTFEGAPQGAIFQAEGPDFAHFDEEYFTEGEFYAAPALEGSLEYYKMAKMVFSSEEDRIINLTPGTAEDVFEKGEYAVWL